MPTCAAKPRSNNTPSSWSQQHQATHQTQGTGRCPFSCSSTRFHKSSSGVISSKIDDNSSPQRLLQSPHIKNYITSNRSINCFIWIFCCKNTTGIVRADVRMCKVEAVSSPSLPTYPTNQFRLTLFRIDRQMFSFGIMGEHGDFRLYKICPDRPRTQCVDRTAFVSTAIQLGCRHTIRNHDIQFGDPDVRDRCRPRNYRPQQHRVVPGGQEGQSARCRSHRSGHLGEHRANRSGDHILRHQSG